MSATSENLWTVHASKPSANITWTIENFTRDNQVFYSPSFRDNKKSLSLCLKVIVQLFESGLEYSTLKETIFISLQKRCYRPSNFHFRVSFLNDKGERCLTQEGQAVFESGNGEFYLFCIDSSFLWNKLVVNGKLTIYCEVYELSGDPYSRRNQDSLISMTSQYQTLLESGKFADVTLLVGCKKFKAHKLILSARSPVFAAMFEHDFKVKKKKKKAEKRESKVTITDVSAEVFQELLGYIYSVKTPTMDKFSEDLLAAADKYQLDDLKSLCGKYMASQLNYKSVFDQLLLADMYHMTEFKTRCIEYIANNASKVMASEEWNQFVTTNRIDLITEIMKKLALIAKC